MAIQAIEVWFVARKSGAYVKNGVNSAAVLSPNTIACGKMHSLRMSRRGGIAGVLYLKTYMKMNSCRPLNLAMKGIYVVVDAIM